MPDTHDSYVEKEIVKRKIIEYVPSLRSHIARRPDWLVSAEENLSVFITFSKEGQLFYDINIDDINKFLKYESSFIVFVLGKNQKTLIVPFVEIIKSILNRNLAEDGAVKLHITETGAGIYFKEAPDFNMKKYLNKFDQFSK